MPWKRLRLTLEMIKFEHSVFALPFALTGALLAFREGRSGGGEIAGKLLQLQESWDSLNNPMPDTEADAILQKVFPDEPRAGSPA